MNQVPTQRGQSGSSGVVISALRGGSGKTILSIGIIAALRNLGHTVAPFKKGPDYIDAGWLALAAGRSCYNLDTFLIDPEQILRSYAALSANSDIAVIEGNRGLYDAIDTAGETSTAELAKLLNLPVILCLDCTKTTRTMAAVVSGCDMFDDDVRIKGVILNRVAGARHENILRKSIEEHCGIPVLGALPKLKDQLFPERHMGLVPTPEHDWAKTSIQAAAHIAETYLCLDALMEAAGKGSTQSPEPTAQELRNQDAVEVRTPISLEQPVKGNRTPKKIGKTTDPVIGVVRDAAFQFYYPENIEALQSAGAKVVYTSPLSETLPPEVHALYIGGGFPETHAKELGQNLSYRTKLKNLADAGLPIYGECGGLMYLGRQLVLDEKSFPMTGVLPIDFGFSKKPHGHGYTIVSVEAKNPFFPVGTQFKGHEFHYSTVLRWDGHDRTLAFAMKRGVGILNGRDGICYKNVLATYTHIHAHGVPQWAGALVRNARIFQNKN